MTEPDWIHDDQLLADDNRSRMMNDDCPHCGHAWSEHWNEDGSHRCNFHIGIISRCPCVAVKDYGSDSHGETP